MNLYLLLFFSVYIPLSQEKEIKYSLERERNEVIQEITTSPSIITSIVITSKPANHIKTNETTTIHLEYHKHIVISNKNITTISVKPDKDTITSNTSNKTNMTEEHELIGEPIMLTIRPNVTVFEGDGNLTCIASGSNLPKITPYELVWFEQGVGGSTVEILKRYNTPLAVLDQITLQKHGGQSVFCALLFNHLPPFHWMMASKYISIAKSDRVIDTSTRKTGMINALGGIPTIQETQKPYSNKALVFCVTGVTGLLVLIIVAVFLYRRFHKKSRTPRPISEEPSISQSQDNIYTYVPLQPIPFYEAKKMVAANLKNKPASVRPPPLPARPKHHRSINEEEEYTYSYTYGVNK